MKKRLLAAVLACAMMLGLTACSGLSSSKWTENDFTFKGSEDEITLKEGRELLVYEDVTYVRKYSDGSYDQYDEEYETQRGLTLGMELSDYKKHYNVVKGYAVWEIYSGDDGMYTSFAEYNNEDPDDMYGSDVTNVWLDLGFYKQDGKWVAMQDVEVQNIWFCEEDQDDYDECVILSVNLSADGEIIGLGCNHFSYDDEWVEWQAWAE